MKEDMCCLWRVQVYLTQCWTGGEGAHAGEDRGQAVGGGGGAGDGASRDGDGERERDFS